MQIKEIQVQSILNKSNIPSVDYAINPYVGCGFACNYCYASFMSRFANEDINNWGNYVHVKMNAPELLRKKLRSLKNKNGSILFSSVTDSWQYVEKSYEITRKLLKILVEEQYSGEITCLTKSNLITRDLDVIKELLNKKVGFSITSDDDKISSFLEGKAPKVSSRLEALKKFNEAGMETYAFIGPVLPYFYSRKEELEKVFKAIKEAGTDDIFVERLNTSDWIMKRLDPVLKLADEQTRKSFTNMQNYAILNTELDNFIYYLIEKYKMNLMLKEIIQHRKY